MTRYGETEIILPAGEQKLTVRLGTGEATQGPVAAAIGNAIADATGVRLRDLPLSPRRIREAMRQVPSRA